MAGFACPSAPRTEPPAARVVARGGGYSGAMNRPLPLLCVLLLFGCVEPAPPVPEPDDDDVATDDDDVADDDDSGSDDDDVTDDDDDDDAADDDDSAVQPCLDDDFMEPNDSSETAHPFGNFWLFGLPICAGADDWYMFTAEAGEWVFAAIEHDPSAGDLTLRLYDSDGVLVDEAASDDPWEEVSLGLAIPESGLWKLQVTLEDDPDSPGTSYDLGLNRCGADMAEPNEELAEAHDSPGSLHWLNLTLCVDEVSDWYLLPDVPANSIIDLRILFDATEGDIDARLYDSGGSEVASGSNEGIMLESLLHYVPNDGDYFLEIFDAAEARLPGHAWYDMSLPIVPVQPVCEPDLFEPDDEQADATNLTTTIYDDELTACEGDIDWYRLELQAGDVADLLLDFTHAEGDLDLFILDEEGNELLSGTTTDDDELLSYAAAGDEIVYARVDMVDDLGSMPGNQYSLAVSGFVPTCIEDQFEPNDSPAEAVLRDNGLHLDQTICPGESDWYRMELNHLHLLTLYVGFLFAEGNVDAYVYDSTGTNVVASGTEWFIEEFSYLVPETGTYYLEIVLESDMGVIPGNIYDFDIVALPSTSCSPDMYEPNDDTGSATPIGSGDSLGQMSVCLGEPDFFSIDVSDGDDIDLEIGFDVAEGDVDLTLYDAAGQDVVTADSGTGVEVISHTVPEGGAGIWMVEVWLASDAGPMTGIDYELEYLLLP